MSRSTDLLSNEGFRMDGRKPGEVRKLSCKWGIFEQADGSAYLEMGNTRVLAAVYGPHEVRSTARTKQLHDRAVINCQYSMATFSTSERSVQNTLFLKSWFNVSIDNMSCDTCDKDSDLLISN